jgi:NAD(P)H-flavin reductase/formate hydrogenlyase subunit 6/NADH:ubiquinone oxidoreductase subunit I
VIDVPKCAWLPREELDRLIALLREDGRKVVGPTVQDAAIVYDEIVSSADLPTGITDEQAPGKYRIKENGNGSAARSFDFASSPMSWKSFTFPASVVIASAKRQDGSLDYEDVEHDSPRMAYLGVRACDIAAMGIHDDVLAGGPYIDEDYADRRGKALIVGVECARPSGTCFCASMGTGPEVSSGFDIALTELDDGYVVKCGSEAGNRITSRLELDAPTSLQLHAAAGVGVASRAIMSEQLGVTTEGLKERLVKQVESGGWDEIAEVCLACTNCTMACPTCFCTDVKQTSDLMGTETVSERQWASCFTLDFARVAHGNFRPKVKDRYRQWLTHKFSTWVDQFGSYGCVGCGRCITWCPVGIDVRKSLLKVAPVKPPVMRSEKPVPVSANPGHYSIGTISDLWAETRNVYTLQLKDLPEAVCCGTPGQFLMLDLPGFSAVPISISRYRDGEIFLTVRTEGATTRAIASLQRGAQIGLRGPVGRGWPIEEAFGRDVVIVAGGIGLPPLRPLIDNILASRGHFGRVRLFYGARTPADLLFTEELKAWSARSDISVGVTVDRAKVGTWSGAVGVVTHMFDREPIDGSHTTAYICGPEKMMSATANSLAGRGILPENLFLSMERHMQCGIGLCGHCQMGKNFVCKDGPVFSRRELGETLDVEGL